MNDLWYRMVIVDYLTILQVERINLKIEALTGINCFNLARACFGIVFVNLIMNLFRLISSLSSRTGSFKSFEIFDIFIHGCVQIYCLYFVYNLMRSIRLLEKAVNESSDSGMVLVNPLKLLPPMISVRILSLFFLVIFILSGIIFKDSFLFGVLGFYSMACNPLPPGSKSKLSEFVESFRPKPAMIPVRVQS